MDQFKDKVVLVTGGSRNTGLEITDHFLREGARVFFCGTSEKSVEAGAAELRRRGRSGFRGVVCNVADPAQVSAFYDVIEREAGRLDIVISNAADLGIGHGPTDEMSLEALMGTLAVNLGGTFLVVQTAIRRFFLKQERDPVTDQRGVVVCIGSNTSEHVSHGRLAYCTSKGGLDAMVRCFATDLGPRGIRVNLLAPGYIWTPRWDSLTDETRARRRENTLTGHEATGADVAAAAAFLASDGARSFQGSRLVMDSGVTVPLVPASCEDDTNAMKEA